MRLEAVEMAIMQWQSAYAMVLQARAIGCVAARKTIESETFMDGEQINKFIETFGQQILNLQKHQAELLVAVTVLRGLVAIQMFPHDPLDGTNQILTLEKTRLASDPTYQDREEFSELIQALRDLKRMGGGPHEA